MSLKMKWFILNWLNSFCKLSSINPSNPANKHLVNMHRNYYRIRINNTLIVSYSSGSRSDGYSTIRLSAIPVKMVARSTWIFQLMMICNQMLFIRARCQTSWLAGPKNWIWQRVHAWGTTAVAETLIAVWCPHVCSLNSCWWWNVSAHRWRARQPIQWTWKIE